MSFWINYILLKEKEDGQTRETILQQLEDKFGLEKRQSIENELTPIELQE